MWGDGDNILWAEGESLIIAGPDGVGKTTVAGLIRAPASASVTALVLGMAVTPGKQNVLLCRWTAPGRPGARCGACSPRPTGTSSSSGCGSGRDRPGRPRPQRPDARRAGSLADADTIVVNSLKDAALKLADDETGSG